MPQPSPYWGDEAIWTSRNNVHNPMFDDKGRVWITSAVRPPDNPAFCKAGSTHPSAKLFPLSHRRPSSRRLRSEDEEADAHQHLLRHASPDVRGGREPHAVDERRRPGGRLAEHEDVRRDAATRRSRRDGRRSSWTRTATASATPTSSRTSRSIRRRTSASAAAFYAVAPAPDGSVWGIGARLSRARSSAWCPGSNPPETALAEVYEPPFDNPKATVAGLLAARHATSIATASYWAALASGHLASFDRRKCKGPLNGPTATGQHCPEGWTLYPEPLPQIKGVTDSGSAEAQLLHLGRSVRHARARREHADRHRQRVRRAARAEGRQVGRDCACRIRSASTRNGWTAASTIPNAGWKGRGLWSTVSTRAPFHMETGKGTTSKVIKFQLRPDPLAK